MSDQRLGVLLGGAGGALLTSGIWALTLGDVSSGVIEIIGAVVLLTLGLTPRRRR